MGSQVCYQCSGIGLTQSGVSMVPVNGTKIVAPGIPQVACTACGGTGIERSFGS